jgi:hypothetical protein
MRIRRAIIGPLVLTGTKYASRICGHAPSFGLRRSGWVCFVQVRALWQSEVVALSLMETAAVVTS